MTVFNIEEIPMPFPLFPFIAGAAAGAAITYLFRSKTPAKEAEPKKLIREPVESKDEVRAEPTAKTSDS